MYDRLYFYLCRTVHYRMVRIHIGHHQRDFIAGLSSFFGLFLIRTRGWYTLFNVRQQLAQGGVPTVSLLKSGCRIFAGIFIFITDFLPTF